MLTRPCRMLQPATTTLATIVSNPLMLSLIPIPRPSPPGQCCCGCAICSTGGRLRLLRPGAAAGGGTSWHTEQCHGAGPGLPGGWGRGVGGWVGGLEAGVINATKLQEGAQPS
jgi:hypothetical protein